MMSKNREDLLTQSRSIQLSVDQLISFSSLIDKVNCARETPAVHIHQKTARCCKARANCRKGGVRVLIHRQIVVQDLKGAAAAAAAAERERERKKGRRET